MPMIAGDLVRSAQSRVPSVSREILGGVGGHIQPKLGLDFSLHVLYGGSTDRLIKGAICLFRPRSDVAWFVGPTM